MLERLAGTVLDNVLSKYFEPVDSGQKVASVGIWSGYLSLSNLRFKVEAINELLKSAGHPFRLVQGSLQHVEITVPWTQWSALMMSSPSSAKAKATSTPSNTPATAVIVLDGLHVLLESTPYDFDDNLLRAARVKKRRSALQQASEDMMASANPDSSATDETPWLKRTLKQALREGLFLLILDRLQVHIRDVHIRMEDVFRSDPEHPFAAGIVLESMHIQHDQQQGTASTTSGVITKSAQVNHFGFYWNPLQDSETSGVGSGSHHGTASEDSTTVPSENRILRDSSFDDIVKALDQSIARRATALHGLTTAPAHTYIVQPHDVYVELQVSKNPSSFAQPALTVVCRVNPNISFRDFQCLQLLTLVHHWKEHKYHVKQEYRRFRPTCSVKDNPRAWWEYVVKTVLRFQLDQRRFSYSVERARQRLQERKLYCDLYERLAAGGEEHSALSDQESKQLQDLEDGVEGELSIPDILLFRIMVRKRLGKVANGTSSHKKGRTWVGGTVQTLVADDMEAKQEYERVLQYWSAWSSAREQQQGANDSNNFQNYVSVQVSVEVSSGRLTFFAPLSATTDQPPFLRLQERFLEFRYTEFVASLALMGDYETLSVDVSLADFATLEIRSDRSECRVVSQIQEGSTSGDAVLRPPLIGALVTKYPRPAHDFDYVIQCRALPLQVSLDPQAEWAARLRRSLRQSIPKLRKVEKFWDELSLANINSWASQRLGLLAKADTAASDNKKFDLDIDIHCPVIRLLDGEGTIVQLDLGRAIVSTRKLAGVADTKLLRSSSLDLESKEVSSAESHHSGNPTRSRQRYRGLSLASNGGSVVKTGDRSIFDSTQSLNGSLRLGEASNMFTESFRNKYLPQAGTENQNMDSFFYNTYELRYEMGPFDVVKLGVPKPVVVSSGINANITLHKSILPADHTLFRQKLIVEIEEIALNFSMDRIQLVRKLLHLWSSKSSASQVPSRRNESELSSLRVLRGEVDSLDPDELSAASGFNEQEFFDAMENDSQSRVSDDASAWLDEHWLSDSTAGDSILDGDSQSVSKMRRRRRRARSISEVSSLSEGSATRLRRNKVDTSYLSAENLAKLEEEGIDESVNSMDDESEAASFHSAVSLSNAAMVLSEMNEDIVKAESSVVQLRLQLAAARRDGHGPDTRERTEKLAIGLKRAKAELEGLRAARLDLEDQMAALGEHGSTVKQEGKNIQARASRSVRQASMLLHSRQKAPEGNPHDHSLTRGLQRKILQVSVSLQRASFNIDDLVDLKSSNSFNICHVAVSGSRLAFLRSIGESRVYFDVEGATLSLKKKFGHPADDEILFVGGLDCGRNAGLLPEAFPQIFCSTTSEEDFLECSVEMRQGRKDSFREAKIRILVGDTEIRPAISSVDLLHQNLRKIQDTIATDSAVSRKSDPPRTMPGQSPLFFDVMCRFFSARTLLIQDSEQFGAVVVSDCGVRLAGASSRRLYNDRSQIDLRCSNIQVIALPDADQSSAVEIFGKQEAFGPLIRLRCRRQLVPNSELSGWAINEPQRPEHLSAIQATAVNTDPTIKQHVWNCYITLKVESLSAVVVPSWISTSRRAILSLRNIFPRATTSEDKRNGDQKTTVYPVRWRFDTSQKDSTFLLREKLSENHRDPYFALTWAASIVAQRSSLLKEGLAVETLLENVSLVRLPEERHVIKPTMVVLGVDVAMKSSLCCPLDKPCLQIQQTWQTDGRLGYEFKEHDSISFSDDSISIRCSTIHSSLTGSTCNSLKSFCKSLVTAFRVKPKESRPVLSQPKLEDEQGSTDNSRKSDSRSRRFRLHVTEIVIVMTSEARVQKTKPDTERLFSVSLLNSLISVGKNRSLSSIQFELEDATLTDLSCNPGARAFETKCLDRGDRKLLKVSMNVVPVGQRYRVSAKAGLSSSQFVVLPSLFRSLVRFSKELRGDSTAEVDPEPEEARRDVDKLRSLVYKVESVDVSIHSEGGEIILSSKDLLKQSREKGARAVGSVVVRWRFELKWTLNHFNGREEVASVAKRIGSVTSTGHEANERLRNYVQGLDREQDCSIVAHTCDINVHDFQILRSAVSATEDLPRQFLQTPTASGEQRITNSFGFSLKHKLRALLPSSLPNGAKANVAVAQGLEVTVDFVDALMYIAQSESGLNEAARATILPILETFRKSKSEAAKSQRKKKSSAVGEIAVGATTVFSVRTEGIQITCVPGGVTRLTESPIIKFALLKIAGGGATVPVKTEASILSESSLKAMVASSHGVDVRHVLAGTWFNCEVSASYNNRRLAAWEPFIEPWFVGVRLGADLMQIFKLSPLVSVSEAPTAKDKDVIPPTSAHFDGRGRLRDIGRLLSSPFKQDKAAAMKKLHPGGTIESDADFCFYALSCSEDAFIEQAVVPQSSSAEMNAAFILPQAVPGQWLSMFGIPPTHSPDNVNTVFRTESFNFCVTDSAALNVNLSGALIENLSQFIGGRNKTWNATKMAPHRLRNNSGLTIRLREVLDAERANRGESANDMLVANGGESPLSLKRSLSQSCDPHRAFITIELGSFEDTVDRLDQVPQSPSEASRFSAFSFKVSEKIPVDTVGIHQYQLESNISGGGGAFETKSSGHRTVGSVIVRVSIKRGIKLVTVESPVLLKNTSDNSLLCEVRDKTALSVIWRTLVPPQNGKEDSVVPIPVDLVPLIRNSAYVMSAVALSMSSKYRHESEVALTTMGIVTPVVIPAPFSQSSYETGLIAETHTTLHIIGRSKREHSPDYLHLNLCSLRLGSFSYSPSGKAASSIKLANQIPEQRMLLFRPPLVFRNHLAFSMMIRVRAKAKASREDGQAFPWIDLGILHCGCDCSWSGALHSASVEVRIRFCELDGSDLRQFPDWSSVVDIPPLREGSQRTGLVAHSSVSLPKLEVVDGSSISLQVAITSTQGSQLGSRAGSLDDVSSFSSRLSAASRVIGFHTPFWVIDGTGLDLEYRTKFQVAGQDDADVKSLRGERLDGLHDRATLGLGELLEDRDLVYLPSRKSFRLLMIGHEEGARLFVRQRLRSGSLVGRSIPWSDSIPLTNSERSYHDTFISVRSVGSQTGNVTEKIGPFALRSRLIRAPDALGGKFGTILIHVVCQYAVVNELSRDMEVAESSPSVLPADGRPRPFHFDDSRPIRLRPKEFGWAWSGKIDVTKKRKELTLCLRHKMKGLTEMVTLEFRYEKGVGTCTIIMRPSTHAPYRVENRTMFPLQFSKAGDRVASDTDTVILPFHNADWAWDEPDYGKCRIALSVTDFRGDRQNSRGTKLLGSFRIDNLSPGTELVMKNKLFKGTVAADGPTRVLRISAVGSEMDTTFPVNGQVSEMTKASTPNFSFSVKLAHGIGISVVNWTPKELLYILLDDITIEHVRSFGKESVTAGVGRIVANNQLWVTPYPVMLRMGSRSSRRRSRRKKAASLTWCRSLSTDQDLVLVDTVELSTEPSVISVDGNLAALTLEMLQQVREMYSEAENPREDRSRNDILRKVLKVKQNEHYEVSAYSQNEKDDSLALELYSAVDYMATAALASKLRLRYKPPDEIVGRSRASGSYGTLRERVPKASRRHTRKYYVEKLRISTTKADISWSGPLPIVSLPPFMRPTLTFEGLPVLLRPFSMVHCYGEGDEYLRTMKSHYLSIWRVFDLLVGVLANPTFLVRACVFTCRESISAALERTAHVLQTSEVALSSLVKRNDGESRVSILHSTLIPVVEFNRTILGGLAQVALITSSVLHYDASWYRARAGLMRSRNPRLFANEDGRDVLVQYVEGENAGRAFLSRVRQGMHLGEGYVFHVEGVHRLCLGGESRKRDEMPLIFMLTFDHILLLNGELKESFCAVLWEVPLKCVVYIEAREVAEGFQVVVFWYLRRNVAAFKREDRFVTHARSVVGGSGGLGCMHCKELLIPVSIVDTVLEKIKQVDHTMLEP